MVHLLSQKLFNKVQIVKVFSGPSILPTIHRHLILLTIGMASSTLNQKDFWSTFLTPSRFLHLSKVFWSLNQPHSWKCSSPLGRSLNNIMTKVVERYFFGNSGFCPNYSWVVVHLSFTWKQPLAGLVCTLSGWQPIHMGSWKIELNSGSDTWILLLDGHVLGPQNNDHLVECTAHWVSLGRPTGVKVEV